MLLFALLLVHNVGLGSGNQRSCRFRFCIT